VHKFREIWREMTERARGWDHEPCGLRRLWRRTHATGKKRHEEVGSGAGGREQGVVINLGSG
jgi:hypothetical protein